MAYENLKLGVSPITNNVFAGRLNKKGTMWTQKVDVTEQFLNCVLQYFKEGTEHTVTSNGKPVIKITVEQLDRDNSPKEETDA